MRTLKTGSLSSELTFFRACSHAGLAGVAGRPGSAASTAEATNQAETAMALLRQAVLMGYRNPDAYRAESALDPVPRPGRLPPADDGPGFPGRPVRRSDERRATGTVSGAHGALGNHSIMEPKHSLTVRVTIGAC